MKRPPRLVAIAVAVAVAVGVAGPHGLSPVAGASGTPVGTVSNYADATIAAPTGIAAGPDGALWFTNFNSDSIGRITTAGVVSNYTGVGLLPEAITAGSDGALWFTHLNGNSIGRITTTGVVSSYTGTGVDGTEGITAGPDGALWFTNSNNASIGRLTTAGAVSNYTSPGIDNPYDITAGPDGALWFTNFPGEPFSSSIGRITTSGVVSGFTGSAISQPYGITAGPDGALWFANGFRGYAVGRITTTGAVSAFTGPGVAPYQITAGPDGALWFTNPTTNSIGRVTAVPPTTVKIASTGGPMCAGTRRAVRVELVVNPRAGTAVAGVTDAFMHVTAITTAPNSWLVHLKSNGNPPSNKIPAHTATVVVRTATGDSTFTVAIPAFTCT